MKSKKYSLVILSIFLVLLLFIGSASAAKVNETDIASIDKSTSMVNEKLALDSSLDNAVSNDKAVENNGNNQLSANNREDILKESANSSNDLPLSEGALIYVNSSAGDGGDGSQENPFQTLDDALNKTTDGDTIMIASGLYNGTKNTGLTISTNNLKFIKYGDSEAIFDAENQRGIFDVQNRNTIHITGLTFKNGNGNGDGGAVHLTFVASFLNCIFINNTAAGSGGAIYSWFSDTDVTNVTNCTFINNTATSTGGAYHGLSGGRLVQSTFIGNKALGGEYSNGGAICIENDVPYIFNCVFINNTADASGGAIRTCSFNVGNCTFIDNTAIRGNAINIDYGNVNNCSFINNIASKVSEIYINGDNIVDLNYNWWGSNNPNWNALIEGNHTLSVYAVLNVIVEPTEIYPDGKSSIKTKFVWNNTDTDATSSLPARDVLLSSNGTLTKTEGEVGLTSQFSANAGGLYYVNAEVDNEILGVNVVVNKYTSKIEASPVVTVYNVNKNLIVTLTDANGKPLSNSNVTIDLNGVKIYTTDKNGQIKVSTKGLNPKIYTAKAVFNGNANYTPSTLNVKVTINKAKTILKAKNKAYKAKKKVKKFNIVLKNNIAKPIAKAKVTLKIGKKTYSAKTNSKGVATFKITKLTKKGKYKATVTYKGNNCYNKANKKVKIILK